MISSNDLKPGLTILVDGEIYMVLEASQNKTARSAMVVKAKVRNVRTGSNVELSWGGGEKVEPAQIEKREMQYLYDTDEAMVSAGLIFYNTNLAAAVATCTTMIFTWIRYKKPDVSMSLNGTLAGLVAITAGCDVMDPFGAAVTGIVAGIIVVLIVELLDKVLKIDDPVGAVAVHCGNGVWGTIAVGLFATDGGLFYGGGFRFLGIQILGVVSVLAWVTVCMVIIFTVLKNTVGLRVSAKEEIEGLDATEHGLASAYAGFAFSTNDLDDGGETIELGSETVEKSVPVTMKASLNNSDAKITEVEIIMKQAKFEALKKAMNDLGVTGMTVTQVLGCGVQKGATEYYRGVEVEMNLLPKIKVEMVVAKVPVLDVINTARKVLYTGHIGDGKIFVHDIEDVVKIRTGETGYDALQGADDF